MTVSMKNGGYSSLLSDVFTPDPLFGRDFFESDGLLPRLGINVPPVNISETPKEYSFELAAPGMTRKDFKLEIDDRRLNIIGERVEKKEEKDWEGKNFSRKEFSYKSFHRAFQIPENSKLDRVDAKYENGILKIIIPKKEVTGVNKAYEIPVT